MPPHLTAVRTFLIGPERLEARELPSAAFQSLPSVPNLDAATQANVRRIAALGRDNGLRQDAFLKAGDSNTDTNNYLRPIGFPEYNPVAAGLAGDPNLLATVNNFHAPAGPDGLDSFARNSLADFPGWRVINVLGAIDAEAATTRAGIALVMIGTNDVGLGTSDAEYRAELAQLVDRLAAKGVIPILSTLPHNLYTPAFEPRTNQFNQIIADVASDQHLPLMNLSTALDRLPAYGLDQYGVHLSVSPNGGGSFHPVDLLFGQNARGLLTIQALGVVRATAFQITPTAVIAASGLTPWSPLEPGEHVVVAGPDYGQPPVITVIDPDTNEVRERFLAFEPNFTGGVCVAVADVNGDGVPDIIAAAGKGGGPVVKAFDGVTGQPMFAFFAFEESFRGGVNIAVGDADGDGTPDIVVGAGPGGGPRVRVFRATDLAVTADFMAFEPAFRGGTTVAVGNFGPGTGPAVAVGPGAGGGGILKFFSTTGELRSSQLVFEPDYRGGLNVAAGDLDGDGRAEMVVGPVVGSTRVVVMTADGTDLASFFAGGQDSAGVRVGVIPGRPGRIITGTIDASGSVGLWGSDGFPIGRLAGSDASVLLAGVFVGAG